MKFALLLVLVAFVAISAAEDFKCEQDVHYIENECNGCRCGPNNLLACTYKACLGSNTKDLHNCEVGTTSEKGCNKCWCVKDMGTICTDKKC